MGIGLGMLAGAMLWSMLDLLDHISWKTHEIFQCHGLFCSYISPLSHQIIVRGNCSYGECIQKRIYLFWFQDTSNVLQQNFDSISVKWRSIPEEFRGSISKVIQYEIVANSNLVKSNPLTASKSDDKSFWNFPQSMAVSLPCSVWTFRMIYRRLKFLWINEFCEISVEMDL